MPRCSLRSILYRHPWFGCRDRNQTGGIISIFDLVRKRKAAATMDRTANEAERAAEQRIRLFAHGDFEEVIRQTPQRGYFDVPLLGGSDWKRVPMRILDQPARAG